MRLKPQQQPGVMIQLVPAPFRKGAKTTSFTVYDATLEEIKELIIKAIENQ